MMVLSCDSEALALRWKSATAFISRENGVETSYLQLHNQVEATRQNINTLKLKPGDAIVVLTNPSIEFYILLLACLKSKIILIPLNWRENLQTLAIQIHQINPKLILKGNGSIGNPIQNIIDVSLENPPLEYAFERDQNNNTAIPWFLLYTSGTSGHPKAVVYSEEMVLINLQHVQSIVGLNEHTISATLLPIHHTAGINLFALPTLLTGGTVVIYPGFDAQQLLGDIRNQVFNTLLMVPTIYQLLSDHSDFAKTDFSSLRSASSGGAPISPGLLSKYKIQKDLVIQNGCGMTETGPALFFQNKQQATDTPGFVGQPGKNWQISLRDQHQIEVDKGHIGEIWVKGPGLTSGFFQQDGTVLDLRNEQGWFATGDLAEQQADGQFRIIDRLKDIYICGGENIYPGQVEDVLLQHPMIKEAIVIGVPNETWGEVGVAWISTLNPDDQLDSKELTQHCKNQLASFKVPSSFHKVITFPRTASGKIIKSKLISSKHSE